jgi:hypothetical protein
MVVRFNINFAKPGLKMFKKLPDIRLKEETDVMNWEKQIVKENVEAFAKEGNTIEKDITVAEVEEKKEKSNGVPEFELVEAAPEPEVEEDPEEVAEEEEEELKVDIVEPEDEKLLSE